jgi:hypothetical protein
MSRIAAFFLLTPLVVLAVHQQNVSLTSGILSPALSCCCEWREDRWQDFVDGELDPALFVSRRSDMNYEPGCIEFSAYFDVNRDGWYDLTTTDMSGPLCHIYFGSPTGYSSSHMFSYPIPNGGSATFADLNLDRNPEMLLPGSYYHDLTIYRGSSIGPSLSDTFSLIGPGMHEAVFCVDLDRDAFLDIVVGYCTGGAAVVVFWGSESGYSNANKTTIPLGANVCFNLEVADLDRDGWQEIVFVRDNENGIIHWGPNRQHWVVGLPYPAPHPHGLTVADFNQDGWLDIVCTDYASTFEKTYIFWGSNNGFTLSAVTILNIGEAYGGTAAADFNRDGLLDIVMFFGYDIYAKPMVYYNTGSYPYFDSNHSAEVGPISMCASGGIAADFNFDGYTDLFVNNRVPNGYSYVLWGPDFQRYDALPVDMDHHGTFREPGNVYDRSQTACYYSSVYDAGNKIRWAWACWTAGEPEGSKVQIAYRTGNTAIPDSTWTDFALVRYGGWVPRRALGGRYIQYRATFGWHRPNAFPELEAIRTLMLRTNDGNRVNDVLTKSDHELLCPNPVISRQVIVHCPAVVSGEAKLTIADGSGRILRHEQIKVQANKEAKLNLDGLPSGVYFIKLETGKESTTRRIVVTR